MPVVVAGGHSFHVQELGNGPPVVMLHGLFGSLAAWYFMAASGLSRDYRCRLYDFRGHGRSEPLTTGYDVATMTADLAALTADLDGPFDLVGHSYGAVIALRFAMDRPERVRRLVVVEAPLPPSSAIDPDELLAQPPERINEMLPESLRDVIASGGRRATRMTRSLSFLVYETTLMADLRVEADFLDAELARIAAPTLLVYGDRSSCLETGHRLARLLPDAKLTTLPCSHYLHLEAPAALIAAIATHVRG